MSQEQEMKDVAVSIPEKGMKKRRRKTKKDGKEEQLEDPHAPKLTTKDVLKVIPMIGMEWLLVLCGSLGAIVTGAVPSMFYLFMGDLLDVLATPEASPDDLTREVNKISLIMVGVAAAAALAQGWYHIFLNIASDRIAIRLKKKFFTAMMNQEIGFFDRKKSGALLSNISEDVAQIQDVFSKKLADIGQFATQAIFGLVIAFISSWELSLIMLAAAPVIICIIGATGKTIEIFTKKTSSANEIATATASEVINSMRTVRSMAGEEKECVRFEKDLNKVKKISISKGASTSVAMFCIHGCIWLICSLAFWYGGGLVRRKIDNPNDPRGITIGDLMKVFGMMLMAVLGLGQMFAIFPELAKAGASTKVLLSVILREPQSKKGNKIPNEIKGEIEFKNVDFVYPTRPNVQILKNFNLSIKTGEQVALVGPSGGGKSTVLALLERFYDPVAGGITIDGIDISEIDHKYLHRHMAIVTQEPTLFAATIKENILYGVDPSTVTQEQIENAAKAANAHDFIMKLPNQYDTMIGERGVSLSGGQKQRIAIARAVLQDPKILLLDEATSALDTESERLVQDALDKLMIGRTCIVIAHRLTTVQNADKIVVIENGNVVETGTHQSLLQIENGVYAKLASRQMMLGHEGSRDVSEENVNENEEEKEISLE